MFEKLFNIVEYTQRNIFLTGKAGTGKTTFLNEFIKTTLKKFVVVAPTGIAAINAGGVTIHSMFGLPLTTFLPTIEDIDRNEAINIPQLIPHFKYRREKLKLLQALEILIIDEVSMLRADVLDMIDLSLRSARRSNQPFGDVQLLLIGDLYQLPPVVKQTSERILNQYYASPYFFESVALKNTALITIELNKIFRQTDPVFISVLNAIRSGKIEAIDFEILNARYQPDSNPQESYVYLVSHNYMADAINSRQLKALNEKARICKAVIEGDFKESMYPNDPELLLKPGAQVMFIRNDSSEAKQYYNGRLAKVIKINNDTIVVLPEGSSVELTVEREVWENKKYYLDDKKEIKEDIIGSYEQFPFRLAWAVTIHKSQGLTFDKVIIDAGKSFTNGQVYVALSRCRTLEGIILKSKIHPAIIFRDHRIEIFHASTNASEKIEAIYDEEKNDYAISKLLQTLNTGRFLSIMEEWSKAALSAMHLEREQISSMVNTLQQISADLSGIYEKFSNFIRRQSKASPSWDLVKEKSAGAVHYFFSQVHEKIFTPLKIHYSETKGTKGLKAYNSLVSVFLDELEDYLASLKKAHLVNIPLFTEVTTTDISSKVSKKPSHLISYDLFEEGLSPEQIANQRGCTVQTIYSHFSKIAAVGILDIERIFSEDQINQFKHKHKLQKYTSLTQYKQALPEMEFHQLSVLLKHFDYLAKKK